jgi:hypothetical protein
MTDSSFIQINERAYKYIRQFTIKSVEDAFVELITNSDDAYDRINQTNKTIDIIVKTPNYIAVRDYASGLDGDDMVTSFLQVGNYTSSADARGFFSRGAKDISVLGNVTFHCIKENKYSKCTIDSNAYTKLHFKNNPVTKQIRKNLNIPENGVLVELDITENYNIPSFNDLSHNLANLYSIRNIMSDINTQVNLFYNNVKSIQLSYQYPKSEKLLELVFNVPGYNKEAKLELYKSDEPMQLKKMDKYNSCGILVHSGKIIHDITYFGGKFRQHPDIVYVWGKLTCDYINESIHELDQGFVSPQNPYIIIDPSRNTGLNMAHPFVKKLYSIPAQRLEYVLLKLESTSEKKIVYIEKLSELVKSMNLLGHNLIKGENINKAFIPSEHGKLIKGIQSNRGKFVTVEKNYMLYYDFINKNKTQNINRPSEKTQIFSTNETGDGDEIALYNYVRGDLVDNAPEGENIYQSLNDIDFEVVFVKDKPDTYRYKINKIGNTIILSLNLNDQVVSSFVNSDVENINDINDSKSYVLLAELFVEAFSRLVLEYGNNDNSNELDSMSYGSTLNKIMYEYEENVKKIQIDIYNAMHDYINS